MRKFKKMNTDIYHKLGGEFLAPLIEASYQYRMQYNMTQSQFIEKFHIHARQTSFSRFEMGKTSNPGIDFIGELVQALGMKIIMMPKEGDNVFFDRVKENLDKIYTSLEAANINQSTASTTYIFLHQVGWILRCAKQEIGLSEICSRTNISYAALNQLASVTDFGSCIGKILLALDSIGIVCRIIPKYTEEIKPDINDDMKENPVNVNQTVNVSIPHTFGELIKAHRNDKYDAEITIPTTPSVPKKETPIPVAPNKENAVAANTAATVVRQGNKLIINLSIEITL